MNYGYTVTSPDTPIEPFCNGKIFVDRISDRRIPAFRELMSIVENGDSLTIPGLVSLGSDLSEILGHWSQLRKKGVEITILDLPETADLPGTFDVFMTYLQDCGQALGKETGTGPRRSLKTGIRVGRKPKEIPEAFQEISQDYQEGKLSSREAADKLGISHTTFLRWYREHS